MRARWKDEAGRIYEWDYRHGTVEAYSPSGRHLGEFDPRSGVRTKPPRRNRTIEP
ncbi:MAG: colicin E3/pyocin S6 family cytotoxin [Microvirga sp.]